MAAVARAVSEAAAAAHRRTHHAAADGAAPAGTRPPAPRSWCATRHTASWSPSSCGSCDIEPRATLLEPFGRNTAPAIALAAHAALKGSPRSPMRSTRCCWCCPRTTSSATSRPFTPPCARRSPRPRPGSWPPSASSRSAPETGYGYIERGAPSGAAFRIARFVEKPEQRARARVRRLRRLLLEQRHVPVPRAALPAGAGALRAGDGAQSASAAFRGAQRGPGFPAHRPGAVRRLPGRLDRLRGHGEDRAMRWSCRCDAGWSDVGSWASLHAASDADAHGNVTHGDVISRGHPGQLPVLARAGWSRRSDSRTTWWSRPRMRCWWRPRTGCRTSRSWCCA